MLKHRSRLTHTSKNMSYSRDFKAVSLLSKSSVSIHIHMSGNTFYVDAIVVYFKVRNAHYTVRSIIICHWLVVRTCWE